MFAWNCDCVDNLFVCIVLSFVFILCVHLCLFITVFELFFVVTLDAMLSRNLCVCVFVSVCVC